MSPMGRSRSLSNFQGWSLTPFGLQMSFSQGQVGPEAAGVVSIMLPFTGFAGIERPGGMMAIAATLDPARMPLLPATTLSRISECYKGSAGVEFHPASATCAGGKLNVAAWDQWAWVTPLFTLGASAPEARIKAALCPYKDLGLSAIATMAQLGISYYGWPYSAMALSSLPETCP